MKRRKFIRKTTKGILGLGLASVTLNSCSDLISETAALNLNINLPLEGLPYKISLAQWSLHKALFAGKLDNLDFAQYTKEKFGIDAVEYVNQFFKDKAEDTIYLSEMKERAEDQGVKNLLIMIDAEGNLGEQDEKNRLKAVENHYKWIDAAKFLGCHSIRVNAAGKGNEEDVASRVVDSLGKLTEYGAKEEISIIVENHGGYSSDGKWLANVMKQVNSPYCGTLPDFGNFTLSLFPFKKYDTLTGMKDLMPFAKGVSAKSRNFNTGGLEKTIDFPAIMKIVNDANYHGYVGIEYEGYRISEDAGIMATKNLLIQSGQLL